MNLSQIRSKYLLIRWSETILFGLAAAAIVAAVNHLFFNWVIALSIAAVVGLITIFIRYRSIHLSQVDNLRISLYLNRFYPELKESSDLLVKDPNSLTVLEQIQLNRIDSKISELDVKLPHRLPQSALAILIASLLFFAATKISPSSNPQLETRNQKQDNVATILDPSIKSASISITPPSYTGLSKTETSQFTFSAVEGSQVTWTLNFHQSVQRAKLTTTTGDSLIVAGGEQIQFKYTLAASVLYRIQWIINNESHSSEYYRIDVKPDQIPGVAIKELPQFTRLKFGDRNTIDVVSNVSDDYGLTNAHVIATVSKGSGESVKFREEKLAFASPSKITGKSLTGKLTLDFRKLGMDPGDEVYFYVEAFDNKQPQSQRNRTDTYFIALQDTATQEMVMDEGLGVDLMPDYFRSQRQLIIDTEKLLAEQKAGKVTKQQFNSTSNELGYDQKVLRLRYGQFLGEEMTTTIGPGETHEEGEEHKDGKSGEDIIKQYGHQHDTENEHNLVADKKEKEDPLAAFKHNHDNEEEATFFTMSVKAKLRAALTMMWDSELKLRMYQPKESLPTQYQILKLLKEISNDSRIYVHRMGFDPPPIKEDKRLTGSLQEVKPGRLENNNIDNLQYPAIRAALSDLSTVLLNENINLNEQQRADLNSAGDELAALALKLPGNYLKALSDLKLIAENKIEADEVREKLQGIQKAFWTVLPNEAPSPTQRSSGAHSLDLKFLEEIKAKAND